jgi:hypothetical protein
VPVTFSARTISGGDWLKTEANGNRLLTVHATAVNLSAGTYTGEIVVEALGLQPVTIPVTLTVLTVPSGPQALHVTSAAVALSSPAGVERSTTITIESAGGPVLVRPTTSAVPGWLHFSVVSGYSSPDGKFTTPAALTIQVSSLQPGTFRGAIVIEATNNSVTVPVTFDATATEARPPQMAAVVNAASGLQTALSPGRSSAFLAKAWEPQVTRPLQRCSSTEPPPRYFTRRAGR